MTANAQSAHAKSPRPPHVCCDQGSLAFVIGLLLQHDGVGEHPSADPCSNFWLTACSGDMFSYAWRTGLGSFLMVLGAAFFGRPSVDGSEPNAARYRSSSSSSCGLPFFDTGDYSRHGEDLIWGRFGAGSERGLGAVTDLQPFYIS